MKVQQDPPWTMAVTTLVGFVSFSSLPVNIRGCTGMVIVRRWHTWALSSGGPEGDALGTSLLLH